MILFRVIFNWLGFVIIIDYYCQIFALIMERTCLNLVDLAEFTVE